VRDRLNGRVRREGDDPAKLHIELDRLLAEQKALQARRPIDMGIIESCKAWLDRLPAGTNLEPVAVVTDGHDLAGVRARINAANAELEALRRAPAPSEDIEVRVRITFEGSRRRCGAWESASDSVSSGPVPRHHRDTSPSTPVIRWPCWPRCFPIECLPSS